RIEVVRLYAALLGLAWLAGYLLDPRNRGRIGSLAPWLLGGMVAATAMAVPFAIDPVGSAVRWGRLVVLWVGFAVAMPATLGTAATWRRAAFAYVVAGVVFGLLNYSNYLLAPVGLLREIAASPTRFVVRNAFAFGGGVEGHGHEVGHFARFVILLGTGLLLTSRARWERLVLIVLLVSATGALMVSFTKSAWAGLAIGLVVFYRSALRRTPLGERVGRVVRWSWIPVSAMLIVAAGFWIALPGETRAWLVQNFLFRDISGTQRFVLWSRALETALSHPLIGVGLNSLVLLTGDPHNWWLEMLAEGGVLAFVLALAFFLCLWRELAVREPTGAFDARLIRGAAAATVASVAFQGLFEASFLWDFPTWVALGLATAVASWPAAGTLLPVNAVQDSVPQA